MARHFGPLDIECDAPPYSIVQACARIGVKRAEDVAWHELKADARTCVCLEGFPVLEKCTFTYATGFEVAYFIGQCHRCGTIFWKNA